MARTDAIRRSSVWRRICAFDTRCCDLRHWSSFTYLSQAPLLGVNFERSCSLHAGMCAGASPAAKVLKASYSLTTDRGRRRLSAMMPMGQQSRSTVIGITRKSLLPV